MKQRIYVGTYTEPILFGTGEILQGKGEGIYVLELDCDKKKLSVMSCISGIRNPSYLAVSPDTKQIYAVNELKEYEGEQAGSISSFQVMEDGFNLECLSVLSTHGQDPCHVAVTGSGSHIIVSNFMSGSVCAYWVDKYGKMKETDFIQHTGSGVNPTRQKGPHAHSCIEIVDTDKVMIPDLGIDRVVVYRVGTDGSLTACPEEDIICPPGSGPRYGEFHPELTIFYVIHELASCISVLQYNRKNTGFSCTQTISTLPESCENICADLHISKDGRFVYASNRGHDSITTYSVNRENGSLTFLDNCSCGGKTPRNFALDRSGRFMMVGNQDTDEIVLFELNADNGRMKELGRTAVPTPVCICPVQ